MPEPLSDTHPEAEKYQISLLRRVSVAERFSMTRSLSRTVLRLSRRAISRANPTLSELEMELAVIAHFYGDELAELLRDYLERKER